MQEEFVGRENEFCDSSGRRLEDVIGYAVYDKNDASIGDVSAVWADETGQPAFIGIKTGWLMGKTHVAPAYLSEVNHSTGVVRLSYPEDIIRGAPSFDPDTELTDMEEEQVLSYYRGKGPQLPEMGAENISGKRAATRREGREGEEVSIPLHDEELKVGKREVEAGGVRLRKVIRTETVQQPVELKHEDIVIERVPGREASTGRGPAFEGEEIYIPFRREEPVIEKETKLREEVRAHKTTEEEQRTIAGQVRHEDIRVEDERHRPESRR